MAAANTFTWNDGSSTWNTSADWTGTLSSPPVSFKGTAGNSELFILGAGKGSAYTVTLGQSSVAAGAVEITSANATLSVGAGFLLHTGPAALTGANGAGGTLDVSAGTIALSGGTVQFYQTVISGGSITGFGEITDLATGSASFTNNFLTTSGSGLIVASGGLLDIAGAGNNASGVLAASGSYQVNAGATLDFDLATSLGTTTSGPVATVNFAGAAGTVETTSAVSGVGNQFTTGAGTTYTFNATLENLAIGSTTDSPTGASVITINNQTITSATISGSTLIAHTGGATFEFDTTNVFTSKDTAFFSGDNLWVDAICFAAGTRVLTAQGEVAVEDLAVGEMVVTLADGRQVPQPVKWIGQRRIDLTRHHQPNLAAPVRVRAGALAANTPSRDLVLSPDHCLFIDGKLIPAKLLINDMTIVQERETRSVTYYHVELEHHAVLLAEGAQAESYLDTGNRAFFSNAGLALVLHPEFQVNAGLKCWEIDACAPLAVSQPAVEPVWRDLVQRAEMLGYQRHEYAMTNDPDLRLIADGRVVRPLSGDGNRYVFTLPAGVSSVRLASRASVPSYFEAYRDDWRHLGVAIRRIVVRDNAGLVEIPPDHPGLTRGWHAVERNDATMWRWMNGDAVLPIAATDGPAMVEVHVGIAMTHAVEEVAQGRLAA